MISILEVAERVRAGRKMDDNEWGMALFKKLQELVVSHGLDQKGPEEFYEVEDEYADSLFQAGVDFLVEMGIYCTQTHRVITFSEDEIRGAVREAPSEVLMGNGPDQRTWTKRRFEDSRPAGISVAGHGPWSDRMIPLPIVVRELVRHRRVDMIEGFMYANIEGREVNGPVLRAYSTRRAIEKVRDGLAMAGRGGLSITSYPVLTDAFSMVAPLGPERGMRSGDGGFFTILPDLMVEEDLIAASLVYQELGCYCLSGGRGNGPWGGGPGGEMIESIAGAVAQWAIYGDTLLDATGGFTRGSYLGRTAQATGTEKPVGARAGELDWRAFALRKALNRNVNLIFYIGPWGGNRIFYDMTSEQYLLKVALSSIESTITGLNMRVGATNPPTHTSWIVETSDAAIKSGIRLEDFAELSRRVNKEKLSDYSEQSPVQDQRMYVYGDNPMEFLAAGMKAYDWYKQAPTEKYLKAERKARRYLLDIGLKL